MIKISKRTLLSLVLCGCLPPSVLAQQARKQSGSGGYKSNSATTSFKSNQQQEEEDSNLVTAAKMKALINDLASAGDPLSEIDLDRPDNFNQCIERLVKFYMKQFSLPGEPKFDATENSKNRAYAHDAYNGLVALYGTGIRRKIADYVQVYRSTDIIRKHHRIKRCVEYITTEGYKTDAMIFDFNVGIKLLANHAKTFEECGDFGFLTGGDKRNPTVSQLLKVCGLEKLVNTDLTLKPGFVNRLRVLDNMLKHCCKKRFDEYTDAGVQLTAAHNKIDPLWKDCVIRLNSLPSKGAAAAVNAAKLYDEVVVEDLFKTVLLEESFKLIKQYKDSKITGMLEAMNCDQLLRYDSKIEADGPNYYMKCRIALHVVKMRYLNAGKVRTQKKSLLEGVRWDPIQLR